MEGRCATCKWWVVPNRFQDSSKIIKTDENFRGRRVCQLIGDDKARLARMTTGSDMSEMDDFLTAPTFGCVEWESKDVTAEPL